MMVDEKSQTILRQKVQVFEFFFLKVFVDIKHRFLLRQKLHSFFELPNKPYFEKNILL